MQWLTVSLAGADHGPGALRGGVEPADRRAGLGGGLGGDHGRGDGGKSNENGADHG